MWDLNPSNRPARTRMQRVCGRERSVSRQAAVGARHPEAHRILARKGRLQVSCHQLRHTMATQMLNADAALVTIQDLLGHNWIMTTQRYCKVSNVKVQRDYYQAMERIIARSEGQDAS